MAESDIPYRFRLWFEKRVFQVVTDYKLYSKRILSWEEYVERRERARRDYHAFTKHLWQLIESRT